ncbi:MAG: hypothetical protein AAGJ29_09490 [Pseudomonadota bacterium]
MTQAAPTIDLSKAMRVHQIVAQLPCSRTTFYRLRKAGQFPEPFVINGTEYWLREDFEAWKQSTSKNGKVHIP